MKRYTITKHKNGEVTINIIGVEQVCCKSKKEADEYMKDWKEYWDKLDKQYASEKFGSAN